MGSVDNSSMEDTNLAATYSLVYSFLTERSHFKAAEAVKKAAKDIIAITGSGLDGPTLPVIVNQWKKFMASQGKKATSPNELTQLALESSGSDTNSNLSENSESSSEETSSESDADSGANSRSLKSNKYSKVKAISPPQQSPNPKIRKVSARSKVKPPTSKSSPSSSESSSSSDSESDESDNNGVKKITLGSTQKGTKSEGATVAISPKSKSRDSSDSSESSSDGASSSESEEGAPTLKAVAMEVDGTTSSPAPKSHSRAGSSQTLPSIKSSDDSDSDSKSSGSSTSVDDSDSSSDNGSDSDDTSVTEKKSVQKNDKIQKSADANAVSTSAIGSPQKSDWHTTATKRRRTDETGSSVATSIIRQPKTPNSHHKGNGKGQPRKTNAPFSRVKVDEINFTDERLRDNTFGSRRAAANDYGAKASADLIVTRGAGFRKEKNKKKRGSYRGGDITMESHSIKFTD